MIYKIKNKYYIRTAPMKYTEIKLLLKNDDVVIETTHNRILANGEMVITEINFQQEKDNLKKMLCDNGDKQETTAKSSKYRRRG